MLKANKADLEKHVINQTQPFLQGRNLFDPPPDYPIKEREKDSAWSSIYKSVIKLDVDELKLS